MKVTLLCNSDLLGGAAVVTYRLMQALRHAGVDARMLVFSRLSGDPNIQVVGTRFSRGAAFLAERFRIYAANGLSYDSLFKVSIANTGHNLAKHPWIKDADVVVLNYINQGMLSLKGIRAIGRIGKPIVWTMHDMWCATGICHHAYECTNFTAACGECPLLGSDSPNDLSHKTWLRKKALYDSTDITFVAVSRWLARKCAASSLLRGRHVAVIPNAFPVDSFDTSISGEYPALPIDFSKKLILMGAARLDDPVKGLDYAVEALNHLFDNHPEVAKESTAVFFGSLRDPHALDSLRFPYVWLGRINDRSLLRKLYAAGTVVLSTSLYETLTGTLIEGQAAGCLPVTFGRGGQTDIVTHMADGYIADYRSSIDIAAGIRWALARNVNRTALHESVRTRFAATAVAQRYISLFRSLLKTHPAQDNN